MRNTMVCALFSIVLASCGGEDGLPPCYSGYHDEGGVCVENLACGEDTHEKDGKCVPDDTLTCGKDTKRVGNQCVPLSMDEQDMACAMAKGFQTCYTDKDGDGWGISEISVSLHCKGTCGLWGMASQRGDCDDKDVGAYPRAYEQCDKKDNDCDGEVDEGCSGYACALDSECALDLQCSALGYTSDWKPAGKCLVSCRSTTKHCPPLFTCTLTDFVNSRWSCVPFNIPASK